MKKDQEGDYNNEVARDLIPPFLAGAGMGAVNPPVINPDQPRSKEYMAGQILSLTIGAEQIADGQVYSRLQGMEPGNEGTITVKWSGQQYQFNCFNNALLTDNNGNNRAPEMQRVQAFLVGAMPICRFTDTTRRGAYFLAYYPPGDNLGNYNFIQAHTPPVENDPCGKMNLLSVTAGGAGGIGQDNYNIYKSRYFVETPSGDAQTGYPKVRYPIYNEQNRNNPMSHMFITREINIEYKGIKDQNRGNLIVTMTYIKENGKPVFIDEQTNTAGAFQKIKQKLKLAFNIRTARSQHEMIHLSKLNGDVGQVLEKWREISLVNLAPENHQVNTNDYKKAFEAYDSNAIMKAFLEGTDIIIFHIWREGAENVIICKRSDLATVKNVYLSLRKNYISLGELVAQEVNNYNIRIGEMLAKKNTFKQLVEQYNPGIPDGATEEQLNQIYIDTLEHFCKASVLENLVPPDNFNPNIVVMPAQINYGPVNDVEAGNLREVEDAEVMRGYIANLRDAINGLNEIRRQLVIPPAYMNIEVTKNGGQQLADVDLEKEIIYTQEAVGRSKVKPASMFSVINIFQANRPARAKGIFSSANANLGLHLIQKARQNFKKFANYFDRMMNILQRVSIRRESSRNNYNNHIHLAVYGVVGAEAAAHGGRSSITRTSEIQSAKKSNIEHLTQKRKSKTRSLRRKKRNPSKKLKKLAERLSKLSQYILYTKQQERNTGSENGIATEMEERPLSTIQEGSEKNENNTGVENNQTKLENILEKPNEDEEITDSAEIKIKYKLSGGETEERTVNIDKILDNYGLVISEVKSALEVSKEILQLNKKEDIYNKMNLYFQTPIEGGATRTFGRRPYQYVVEYDTRRQPRIIRQPFRIRHSSNSRRAQLARQAQRDALNFTRSHIQAWERRRRMEARLRRRRINELVNVVEEEDSLNYGVICSRFCAIETDMQILETIQGNLNVIRALRVTPERLARIDELRQQIAALEAIQNIGICETEAEEQIRHAPQAQEPVAMENAQPPQAQVADHIENGMALGGGYRKKRFTWTRKNNKY